MNDGDQKSSENTSMEDLTEQQQQKNQLPSQSDIPNVKPLGDSTYTGSNIFATIHGNYQY